MTLACEDGIQLMGHRLVLAASSSFFENILRRNRHVHPLILMRRVKSDDLVALLDFLYFGQASVRQENLKEFLRLAEELEVKGLSRDNLNSSETAEEKLVQKITIPQLGPSEMMVKPEASIDLRKDLSLEKIGEFEHQRKDLSESSMFSSEAKELEATVKAK